MAYQYKGKNVATVRDAVPGDKDYKEGEGQVVITLTPDDGALTIKKTDLTWPEHKVPKPDATKSLHTTSDKHTKNEDDDENDHPKSYSAPKRK